ncbi:unnamed protein product [Phytophthora fragariaefolia]|uniref:Unnamed protein product n=1 Tax=Phytophthora fragariaefolia TaxID=1490495 RepID=A0A9W6U831_9STRA|nr:unnamed protein product [Phytophthora fragariaefolia]
MEDSGSRLPARQDFPQLSDAHWATLEKMVSLLGEAAFAGFLNLPAEQQRAIVERFDKYESSLIAHVSAAAQEAVRAKMRAEAQSAAQASATNTASFTARPTTTKPVKMSVPTFDGKASDSLVFWVREIEITLSAGHIHDVRAQPKTFNEAVHIAMLEDHCVRSAQDHTPHVVASEGPTPMEVSRVESARPQRTQRAGGRCFGCNQPGHFRRKLPHQPVEGDTRQEALGASGSQQPRGDGVGKRRLPVGAGRPAGRLRSSSRKASPSSASPKEQVPGTTLLCLPVAAARSNLVVVTASVKGYPEPMTVLIDSGASFNFATKASVARNNALYASALEAAKSNTNVSVRLATGSIVSTRKVTIRLSVKFDDFNSVEPFIVLGMDDRYDLILGMPWLAKHEPWIDWRSRTIGASHNPLADRALAGHIPSSSRDGSPTQSVVAGSAHVEECAGVEARANKSGRVGAPTTQGVVADSARATEDAGACARTTTSGRAGAPTCRVNKGNKVTSTPKVETSSRDADSAAEDRVPQVFDAFTGEPKVGEALTPLPTVAGLLELEELSYVEVLDSLKAGELAEVVLLRPEGGAMEFNSSSVMDSVVSEA